MTIRTYEVSLATPAGTGVLELNSTSPEAAARRAFWSAVAVGWGDLDEVSVTAVTDLGPLHTS